jgi:DNA-binding LytR/AlgR family response regulator
MSLTTQETKTIVVVLIDDEKTCLVQLGGLIALIAQEMEQQVEIYKFQSCWHARKSWDDSPGGIKADFCFIDGTIFGENGLEEIKKIKRYHPNADYIMVTGNDNIDDNAVRQAGYKSLVIKAPQQEEIKKILEGKKMWRGRRKLL